MFNKRLIVFLILLQMMAFESLAQGVSTKQDALVKRIENTSDYENRRELIARLILANQEELKANLNLLDGNSFTKLKIEHRNILHRLLGLSPEFYSQRYANAIDLANLYFEININAPAAKVLFDVLKATPEDSLTERNILLQYISKFYARMYNYKEAENYFSKYALGVRYTIDYAQAAENYEILIHYSERSKSGQTHKYYASWYTLANSFDAEDEKIRVLNKWIDFGLKTKHPDTRKTVDLLAEVYIAGEQWQDLSQLYLRYASSIDNLDEANDVYWGYYQAMEMRDQIPNLNILTRLYNYFKANGQLIEEQIVLTSIYKHKDYHDKAKALSRLANLTIINEDWNNAYIFHKEILNQEFIMLSPEGPVILENLIRVTQRLSLDDEYISLLTEKIFSTSTFILQVDRFNGYQELEEYYVNRARYGDAFDLFERYVNSGINNKKFLYQAYIWGAEVKEKTGEFEKAFELYQQAYNNAPDSFDKTKDRKISIAQKMLLVANSKLDSKAQLTAYGLLKTQYEESDSELLEETLWNIARLHERENRTAQAISAYKEGLASARRHRNINVESQILARLNKLESGDIVQKLARLKELRTTQEQTGEKEKLIFTNLEIGNLHLQLGQIEDAFDSYQAAAEHKSNSRFRIQLNQLVKSANNLYNIEQFEKSNRLTNLISSLLPEDDIDNQVILLRILAKNYLGLKQFNTALETIDKALNSPSTEQRHANFVLKSDILLKLEKYAEARDLTLNLDAKQGKVRMNLGMAYFGLRDYPNASKVFENINNLEPDELKNVDQALAYSMLSQSLFFGQRINDAIKAQRQLISYLEQNVETERLGSAFLNLTRFQLAAGQINDAKDSIYLADIIIDKDSKNMARLLYFRAEVSQKLGKTDEAIKSYGQAVRLSSGIKDQFFLGSVYYGRGTAYYKKLLLEQARFDLEQSITFFLGAGERQSILQSQLALASVNIVGADYRAAGEILNRLKADPQNEDSMGEILLGLASLNADLTEYKEALQTTDQAIEIFKKQNSMAQLMEATNIKASIFLRMDDFNSAEVNFNKALEYNQTLNNELFTATVVNNLGALYQQTGKYEQALNSYLKAGQIQSDLGFEAELALTMNNIATSYMSLKKYDKAIEYLAKSRDIAEKYDLRRDISRTYSNEGIALFQLGKLKEAKASLRQSYDLQQSLGLNIDQAQTLNNIAFIEKEQGNLEIAVDTIQDALKLLSENMRGDNQQFPNPDLETITSPNLVKNLLLNKGFWLRDLAAKDYTRRASYLKAAADSLSKSIDLLEIIRHQLKGGQSQELLVAENIDVFEQLIKIQYDIGKMEGSERYFAGAFPIAEQSKARSFLDKFQEQIAFSNIALPKSYRDRENLVKSQLVNVNGALFTEINKPESEKDQKKIKQLNLKKTELQLAFNNLKKELEEKYPNYANVKYPKIYDLNLLRARIIDRTSAVISYFSGNEASYGWYISKKQLKMVKFPAKADLKKLIEKYRITLKDPLSFYDDEEDAEVDNRRLHLAIGLKLYDTLIRPFDIEPEIKSILMLADGALHYLPFETLITKLDISSKGYQAANQRYLIEDYSVYYAPSASVLGAAMDNLRQRTDKPDDSNTFLGFGDPEFSLAKADETVKADPVFKQKGFYELSRLHATATEVNKISSLFSNSNQVFYQQGALEEKAKELSESYKYIHFATHGILDEENPEFSGVVLNLVREQKEDGFLKSSEIWDMRLKADLVTLSACETGLGKIVSGEGMVGLTRSFLYAGSASVVVSLWTVADDSTSELMINFYEYLKQGYPKIEALRQAKLEFVVKQQKTGDFQDPFYWGPFVLNGMQQ
ncbi:MAG: CHAT domain-containing protein [Proteobacteria bacterium]|nr:CHAT domain-containing protein [Pseudomonadota bacterium]